jgi:methyl-accepting chemotaxis protein
MVQEANRRRDYFIKKGFQRKVIVRFCALVVLGAAITGVSLYLMSKGTVTTAFVNSRLSIVSTPDYILPILIGSSLISIVFISVATFFAIMYLSHRIAGPLYKIEKSVKEIGGGNLGLKINLRSTDEIAEMAASLNEMTDNIKLHVQEIKSRIENLAGQIDALSRLLKDDSSVSPQAKSAMQELLIKKESLIKELGYFKIS